MRPTSVLLVAAALGSVFASGLVACGSFSADDAPATTNDGGLAEASPDASGAGGEGGTVGEVGELPCDPAETPPSPAVYVSQKTAGAEPSTNDGSATAPYAKIGGPALDMARTIGAKAIVVDEGTYAEALELASFPAGIVVDGAWVRTGAAWTRDCDKNRRAKTLIQSSADVGVRIDGDAVPVVLSNLTIVTRPKGATDADKDGASRYGVFVAKGNVRLENVTVNAAAADPGGAAVAGVKGTALCATSLTCNATPSKGTDEPDAPPASSAGTFAESGFVPSAGAAGAATGGPGTNGTPGGESNTANNCEKGCNANDGCGSVPGTVTSSRGKCGCGGSGGTAGGAGRGGGASVALFVAHGTVSVKGSELVAGEGGDGSPGGAGGAGGEPTAGAKGANAICYQTKCCTNGQPCPGNECGCFGKDNWDNICGSPAPTSQVVAGGSAGGTGMMGGKGAGGGGGAGGPSHAYVTTAGGQVVIEQSKRVFGNGGKGAGGAPGGATGEKP